jgi:predicted DNA-binding ribbon-helix-helix protein
MTPNRPSRARMKSLVEKRSVTIRGHKTCATLELAFWEALNKIADHQATVPGTEHHRQHLPVRRSC